MGLVEAVEETLGELDRMGRLEPVDAARVAQVRSMAAQLEDRPGNAQMWREFRESLERLTVDDSKLGGEVDARLAELSTEVGD